MQSYAYAVRFSNLKKFPSIRSCNFFSTGRAARNFAVAGGLSDPMWWEIKPQSRDRYTPSWGEKLADGNLDEFSIWHSSKLETENAKNCLKVLQVS